MYYRVTDRVIIMVKRKDDIPAWESNEKILVAQQ